MYRKYSIQERFEIISKARKSGLTDCQWCKANNIAPGTFYGWVSQVRKAGGIVIPESVANISHAPKQDVVALEIVNDESNSVFPRPMIPASISYKTDELVPTMEISVSGMTLRISNDVNPTLLNSLVKTIGESLC
ncbi:transposase [Clostridium sp. KNHs205]|uniref:IS66 family insertion sequence element accessory protein TnpA n=1 Tax=Clostridium sp. KNHs205 TaxID=1449050 RepID=UPI00051C6E34|nr:transposase [Clostridium sp. KNHs205]